MKNLYIFLVCALLGLPLAGFGQCSGRYDLTYPSGSATATTSTSNGAGNASASYCPPVAGVTQVLRVVSASASTMTLQAQSGSTTTTQGPVTVAAGGTYVFNLLATSTQAVYTLTSTITCNNPKPEVFSLVLTPGLAVSASPITVCQGSPSTLTATGSSNGGYTWTAPGLTTVTNAGTLVVSPTITTSYTVTAPSSCGPNTQQRLTLTVPTLAASGSATAVCANSTVTLTAATNIAGTTYAWTLSGSAVGTGASITVAPSASSTYRVSTNNPAGCANTSFQDVAVAVAAQTATVAPAAPVIKPGASVTMVASSNLSNATFAWRMGGAVGTLVGTNPTLTVSPVRTTIYTVTCTAGACSTNRNTTVTVSRPLPVELTQFEARWSGQAPQLTWATALELNNNYFVVERSLDGQTFAEGGRLTGAGTTSTRTEYQFLDTKFRQPLGVLLYYRLRQVDFSGQSRFSAVQTVRCGGKITELTASAYPNPFTFRQSATLQVVAPAAGPVACTLRDALGREVFRHTFTAAEGFQQLSLPALATPQAGLYYLVVQQGRQQRVLRLQQL